MSFYKRLYEVYHIVFVTGRPYGDANIFYFFFSIKEVENKAAQYSTKLETTAGDVKRV